MADVVDKKTRSRMMAGVQGKDTLPEVWLRGELHRKGFRFRKHVKSLPGAPDVVLPKYSAVIEIRGCFWHCHGCHLFKWPSSRKEFWKQKLLKNKERDNKNGEKLEELGWRILVVWECAIKGRQKRDKAKLIDEVSQWIVSDNQQHEIIGIP